MILIMKWTNPTSLRSKYTVKVIHNNKVKSSYIRLDKQTKDTLMINYSNHKDVLSLNVLNEKELLK